jgi:hypothetical protein
MKESKFRKMLVIAILAVMVVAGITVAYTSGHSGPELKPVMASSAVSSALAENVTSQMNFSFARLAYTNQPPEFMFSGTAGYGTEAFTTQTGEWLVNNSGYQIMNFNSTSSSVALATFNVGNSLGSNVSYFYNDQRVAFNGSSTSYIYVGETALTGAPAADNVAKASAGASQNNVYLAITYYTNKQVYNVTAFYYESTDSGAYQNQTSTQLTAQLSPLVFYDFSLNFVPSTGLQISVENANGSLVNQTTITTVTLAKNISKIVDLQYGLTGTGAIITDYGYIVDHNVYNTPASAVLMAGALAPNSGIQASFGQLDPGVTSTSKTYSMNQTVFGNVNASEQDFVNVTVSGSNSSINAQSINTTLLTNNSSTEATAANTITDIRAANETVTASGSGTFVVTTYSASSIQTQISNFLQDYVSAKTGYLSGQITIISYLITDISFDYSFGASTLTSMQDYIDSMIPGMLTTNGLALVNTTTGGIMAGYAAGSFYDFLTGSAVSAVLGANGIENPATGVWYSDVALAGFPTGSYIANPASTAASIVVPGNIQFYGFTASGYPVMGAGWNPFTSLSAAGTAVSSFFKSASSTIGNAVDKIASTADNAVIKPVSTAVTSFPTALTAFRTDVSNAVSKAFPVIGGTIGNVSKAVSGTLSSISKGGQKTLSTIDSSLQSVKSGVVGAALTGTSDVRTAIYNLGTDVKSGLGSATGTAAKTLKQQINMDPVHLVSNTVGALVNDTNAVLSPIFTSIKNLGGSVAAGIAGAKTSIVNGLTGAGAAISSVLGDGKNILDSVGTKITKSITGAVNVVKTASGNIGQSVMSTAGKIKDFFGNSIHTIVSWFGKAGYVLEIVGITVVVVLVIGLLIWAFVLREPEGVVAGARKV